MTSKELRKRFLKGSTVILDGDLSNSSEVEVVSQTPKRLFTSVRVGSRIWDVMTIRLTEKPT